MHQYFKFSESQLNRTDKENFNQLANEIGCDEKKFADLMDYLFNGNKREQQMASYVLAHVFNKYPELIYPYENDLIKALSDYKHIALKRVLLKIFQTVEVNEENEGILLEAAFDSLSGNEPIAVKVFAMTVIYQIGKKYPEILHELKICIEDQLPYGSAGFQNRGMKILNAINKKEKRGS